MSKERGPAFNPDAGEHVESAARRLQAMARERNEEVFCLFNDTRMVARPGMSIDAILAGWRNGRRRTNETTPDAVEMLRSLIGTCCSLGSWMTVERLRGIRSALLAERARHAEEVAELQLQRDSVVETMHVERQQMDKNMAIVEADRDALRDQLRKVEGERGKEREHATKMEERALDLVRDVRLAQVELHALRSLLPDVRACAEFCVSPTRGSGQAPPPGARRILAALDSQGGEGE